MGHQADLLQPLQKTLWNEGGENLAVSDGRHESRGNVSDRDRVGYRGSNGEYNGDNEYGSTGPV